MSITDGRIWEIKKHMKLNAINIEPTEIEFWLIGSVLHFTEFDSHYYVIATNISRKLIFWPRATLSNPFIWLCTIRFHELHSVQVIRVRNTFFFFFNFLIEMWLLFTRCQMIPLFGFRRPAPQILPTMVAAIFQNLKEKLHNSLLTLTFGFHVYTDTHIRDIDFKPLHTCVWKHLSTLYTTTAMINEIVNATTTTQFVKFHSENFLTCSILNFSIRD